MSTQPVYSDALVLKGKTMLPLSDVASRVGISHADVRADFVHGRFPGMKVGSTYFAEAKAAGAYYGKPLGSDVNDVLCFADEIACYAPAMDEYLASMLLNRLREKGVITP